MGVAEALKATVAALQTQQAALGSLIKQALKRRVTNLALRENGSTALREDGSSELRE